MSAKVICNNCKKEIDRVLINVFNCMGDDETEITEFEDCPVNAKVIRTDRNWVGYDLTEEEQREDIRCPYCKKFPFNENEIQIREYIEIVCFDNRKGDK